MYKYSEFVNNSYQISEITKDLNNFKWDVCEMKKHGDLLLNSMDLKFLKSYIQSEIDNQCYIIELNIIYSEVYQMPTVYFLINNFDTNKIINFEDYLDLNKYKADHSHSDFLNKSYEISKINHPFNGLVYNFMYLCKFNQLLNEISNTEKDKKNVLILFLTMILQLLFIEIPYEFISNIKQQK